MATRKKPAKNGEDGEEHPEQNPMYYPRVLSLT